MKPTDYWSEDKDKNRETAGKASEEPPTKGFPSMRSSRGELFWRHRGRRDGARQAGFDGHCVQHTTPRVEQTFKTWNYPEQKNNVGIGVPPAGILDAAERELLTKYLSAQNLLADAVPPSRDYIV